MRFSFICLALTAFALPATARSPELVAATNPERDGGFVDLADCRKALGVPPHLAGKADTEAAARQSGSLFNRTAGNLSRCELIKGEYLIVVYPKGSPVPAAN